MTPLPTRSGIVLWMLAIPLLLLSLSRPFSPSAQRAAGLPTAVGRWHMTDPLEMTPRHYELLGTDDAVWREYRDADGSKIWLIAVYHGESRKLHPPEICLEGSDMVIRQDDTVPVQWEGGEFDAGRIRAYSRSEGWDYLSLYVYGSGGVLTASFPRFVLHGLPRALLRQSTRGFLLRAETWVGRSPSQQDFEAAQQRCADFLAAILPAAIAELNEP